MLLQQLELGAYAILVQHTILRTEQQSARMLQIKKMKGRRKNLW